MGKPLKRKKRWRKIAGWSLIALLVILILLVRLVEEIGFDQSPGDRFVVVKVLDGDSVELLGGDRLRLLAVDTPEEGEPLHEEATEFLSQLTLGKEASIIYSNRRRDRYGRLLGYLYIDSVFVNKAILANGLGYLYLFKDNDLESEEIRSLLVSQRRAIEEGVGLWSLKRSPEDYYVNIVGSFRLHRPGCRYVENLKEGRYRIFKTREEGLREGLSPCRRCRP